MTCVEIKDLYYRYPDGTEALRGVNLHIRQGERILIAGSNGAGKSTVLHCLAGLIKGDGQVCVAGESFNNKKTKSMEPSRFGLVFQNPDDQLFCPTLFEDIAFGPRNQGLSKEAVAERVHESLAMVSLDGFEHRHPHRLSIGEKKRAAIAAVLACKPRILALDEPWANLDARASGSIADIIKNFDGTVIVISQELYHATVVCKRMILLDNGRVIADGDIKDLMTQTAVFDRFAPGDGDICPLCYSRRTV
jgi:cobalt/nickel transport system ATP-binding protein